MTVVKSEKYRIVDAVGCQTLMLWAGSQSDPPTQSVNILQPENETQQSSVFL